MGRPPRMTDSELVTYAVARAPLAAVPICPVRAGTWSANPATAVAHAAIWHNRATSQPITRLLTAYDH